MTVNSLLLMARIFFNVLFRLMIFSTWLYIDKKGNFCSMTVLITFYIFLGILVVFNIVFNESTKFLTCSYWIGKSSKCFFFIPTCVLGVIFNSLNSIFSFNHIDYKYVLTQITGRENQKKSYDWHQPSLIKQVLYNIIVVSLMLW